MFTINITESFKLELSFGTLYLKAGSQELWFSCLDNSTGKLKRPELVIN